MRTKHHAALVALAMVWLLIMAGGKYVVGAAPAPIEAAPNDQTDSMRGALAAEFPLRIDTGATKSYTDHDGHVWLADTGFIGGSTYDRPHIAVANTTDDRIYQSERFDLTGYSLPVSNGRYRVRLHFAEMYYLITAAGQRVFNLDVEGTDLGRIDIFAATGGRYRAMSRSVDVTVTDGHLDLKFTALVQYPKIDGIEVLPLAPEPTPYPPRTATPTRMPTATPTRMPTATQTATPTRTATPPRTATPTQPGAPTQTVTPRPSATPTPSATPRVPSGAPPPPIYLPMVQKLPALPSPTPALPPCGDTEDADDTPNTAVRLTLGATCVGSVQQDVPPGDDWFIVSVPAGKVLRVELGSLREGADYDLFLFDANLREVGSSRQAGNAAEHINYSVSAAGTFYIRVVVYTKSAQASNLYVLGAVAQ